MATRKSHPQSGPPAFPLRKDPGPGCKGSMLWHLLKSTVDTRPIYDPSYWNLLLRALAPEKAQLLLTSAGKAASILVLCMQILLFQLCLLPNLIKIPVNPTLWTLPLPLPPGGCRQVSLSSTGGQTR